MPSGTKPRLYVLPALRANVALVIRRGPSRWWHLRRWNLDELTLEPGAWFRGNLYPRRCGVSPDGALLGYFALKAAVQSGWPGAYFAVARVPWLTALVAWETIGTWTGGCQFESDGTLVIHAAMRPEPFHGGYPGRIRVEPLDTDWVRRDVANELSRGWAMWELETDSRLYGLPLPQLPEALLSRAHPLGLPLELVLAHRGTSFVKPGMEGAQLAYFLRDTRHSQWTPLQDVQWADWDRYGRLMAARKNGVLELRDAPAGRGDPPDWPVAWRTDLNDLTPDPKPAPVEAQRWPSG